MENKKKIVVFASGNGSGFENICKKLSDLEFLEISKLYCNNNKALVLDRAKKYGIENFIFQNNDLKNKKVLLDLQKVKPDLIVLAGFLKKIPTDRECFGVFFVPCDITFPSVMDFILII